MSFVWLVSYPKSGSTWVRILLSNYLSEAGDGWKWGDPLIGPPSHLARHEFDEVMGVASSDIPRASLDRFRRRWHRLYVKRFSGTTFTKVHESYFSRFDAEPVFPADDGCRVVYLARNPLDLAGSFAHHESTSVARIVARMTDPDAQIPHGETFFDEHLGGWSEHVGDWTGQSALETLVVRYEDVVADTLGTLKRIIGFGGLEWDARKAGNAIEASRFDTLRRNEEALGFKGRPAAAKSFFRRGRPGGWRQELSPDLARRIVADHRVRMEHLGYL